MTIISWTTFNFYTHPQYFYGTLQILFLIFGYTHLIDVNKIKKKKLGYKAYVQFRELKRKLHNIQIQI